MQPKQSSPLPAVEDRIHTVGIWVWLASFAQHCVHNLGLFLLWIFGLSVDIGHRPDFLKEEKRLHSSEAMEGRFWCVNTLVCCGHESNSFTMTLSRCERSPSLAQGSSSIAIEGKAKYEENKGLCFTGWVLVTWTVALVSLSSVSVSESSVIFSLDLAKKILDPTKYNLNSRGWLI